jgi:hypothetical protein
MGGGKTSTSTSQVSIPPEVLARYNSVNANAQKVAATPFQKYSTDPNAFVAPVNQQQYAGISGVNAAANEAQPYYGVGAQMTMAGAGAVNPNQLNTQQYLSPYLNTVLGTTMAAQGQQNAQQQSALAGQGISAGAFGGDRSGIAQANLAYQQNLSNSQTIANLMNQGYTQAQAVAQQQQGQQLAAEQANQARLLGAGAQLGQLGAGAQAAGLQGAQAQIGAGTLEQQTQQAGLAALYNQFQQQQAYPFQVAQFLANIAEGTGALSGSTTTATQPTSWFGSDRRLKKNIERIGETDEGLPIHKFEYKGDPAGQKHIGFMADEVEKIHPEAVGIHPSGFKMVDYDKAASEGGGVLPQHAMQGFAVGGMPSSIDTAGLQSQIGRQMAGGISPAASAQSLAPVFEVPEGAKTTPINYFADTSTPTTPTTPIGNNHHDIQRQKNSQNISGNGGRDGVSGGFSPTYGVNHGYSPDSGYGGGLSGAVGSFGSYLGNMMGNVTGDSGVGGSEGQGMYAEGGRIHKYDGGSLISPTDLAMILQSQNQMYAPFAESGIYGGKPGGLPGGKGIVPAANLPVAHLGVAQPPQQQQSGLGSIENAVKDYKDLKGIYQEGKGLAGAASDLVNPPTKAPASMGPLQQGTDWAKAAASDASSSKDILSLLGFASGGTVLPYDSNNPLAQVVSESEKTPADLLAEQKGMRPPSSGSSDSGLGGLGTALSLGKMFLGFFNEGGVVREHHADGRAVGYDPTQRDPSDILAGLLSSSDVAQTATDTPDVYSQGLNPAVAPRFRQFAEMAAKKGIGLSPVSETRSPEEQAAIKLTHANEPNFPAAEPYSSGHQYGLATDFSGIGEKNLPALREAAAKTGLTMGADFSNPDMPHVQYGKGAFGGLAPELTTKGGVDVGPDFGQTTHGGQVPSDLVQAAYNRAGGIAPSGQQGSAQPSSGGLFSGLTNESTLLPILIGLGRMAGSPSRYFGAAALQGLGGYAEAVQAQKIQNAQIAKDTLGLAAQRFTPIGNGMYFDTVQGDTIPLAERQSRLAQMPGMSQYLGGAMQGANYKPTYTPSGLPQAQPAVDVAKTVSPEKVAAVQPEVKPSVTNPQVAQTQAIYSEVDKDPEVIKQRSIADEYGSDAQKYLQMAKDPAMIASGKDKDYLNFATQAKQNQQVALTQWKDMRDKLASASLSAVTKQAELPTTLAPEAYKIQAGVKSKAEQEALDATNALNQSRAMMGVMFDPKTKEALVSGGPLGETLAGASAFFKQAGFSDNFIKQWTGTNPADAQALDKLRTAMGSEIARQELAGSPVRVNEFNRFLQSTPGVSMLPQAFQWINENIIQPKAKAQMGSYEKIADMDPAKDNIEKAYYEYHRDNPWYTAASGSPSTPTPTAPTLTKDEMLKKALAEQARRKSSQQQVAP